MVWMTKSDQPGGTSPRSKYLLGGGEGEGGRWLQSLNKWCEEQNRLHPFIILTRIFCKIDKNANVKEKMIQESILKYVEYNNICRYYLLKNC